MSYELAFHPAALAEWRSLDGSVRKQLKTKLAERLEQPHVPAARVSGGADLYKIKLRALGYRLVYQVQDSRITVLVLAVGRRDRNAAYVAALGRIEP
ncbi:type II toxin-antitoxin system RelE family toxin [Chitinimonas koreensis]|uniref:type II toxin-antitoxin system RelE family toxin n=1 Tax=Chitinimonas koreensis TaxID=356302 RepID=UPI000426F295|nr:type II toxin-antitoxin system RelE/ParE family toxin [Chitinimonas koreensis]QNM95422.1 type II toxin-antitoxin system RelE/ParE family toxin [Chitinimonas koreensis]